MLLRLFKGGNYMRKYGIKKINSAAIFLFAHPNLECFLHPSDWFMSAFKRKQKKRANCVQWCIGRSNSDLIRFYYMTQQSSPLTIGPKSFWKTKFSNPFNFTKYLNTQKSFARLKLNLYLKLPILTYKIMIKSGIKFILEPSMRKTIL